MTKEELIQKISDLEWEDFEAKEVKSEMGKLFSWKEITRNNVTFESKRNIVSICFYLKNNLDKSPSKQEAITPIFDLKDQQEKLGRKLGVNHSVIVFLNEKLGENHLSLLFLLHFLPRITGSDLLKILDISTTAIDNNIKWLKEQDFIERVGNDRNGYWQINL